MNDGEDFVKFRAKHHSGKVMDRVIFGKHLVPEEMMDILEAEGWIPKGWREREVHD